MGHPEIKIIVPVNSNGEIDLEIQKEIAENYNKVEEIRTIIDEELNKIISSNVKID